MGVMKQNGRALIYLGLALLVGAFFVPVSRSVGTPDFIPGEVVNFHGLHIQALVFEAGLASIITGTIALGFGMVLEKMDAHVALYAPSNQPREQDAELRDETEMVAPVDPAEDEEERLARVQKESNRYVLISIAIVAAIGLAVLIAVKFFG